MMGQGHSAAYDATADRWETLNAWTSSKDWLTIACGVHPECRQDQQMVYDAVNERLVVYGGAAIPGAGGEGGTAVDDVLAFDTRTGEWTVLLAPRAKPVAAPHEEGLRHERTRCGPPAARRSGIPDPAGRMRRER